MEDNIGASCCTARCAAIRNLPTGSSGDDQTNNRWPCGKRERYQIPASLQVRLSLNRAGVTNDRWLSMFAAIPAAQAAGTSPSKAPVAASTRPSGVATAAPFNSLQCCVSSLKTSWMVMGGITIACLRMSDCHRRPIDAVLAGAARGCAHQSGEMPSSGCGDLQSATHGRALCPLHCQPQRPERIPHSACIQRWQGKTLHGWPAAISAPVAQVRASPLANMPAPPFCR